MIEEGIHHILNESIAQESAYSEEIKGDYKKSFTDNINPVDKENMSHEDVKRFEQLIKIIYLFKDIITEKIYHSPIKSNKLEDYIIDFRYIELEFNKLKVLIIDKNEYDLIVKHLQISLLKENILELIRNNNTEDIFIFIKEEPLKFYAEYNVFNQVNKF